MDGLVSVLRMLPYCDIGDSIVENGGGSPPVWGVSGVRDMGRISGNESGTLCVGDGDMLTGNIDDGWLPRLHFWVSFEGTLAGAKINKFPLWQTCITLQWSLKSGK